MQEEFKHSKLVTIFVLTASFCCFMKHTQLEIMLCEGQHILNNPEFSIIASNVLLHVLGNSKVIFWLASVD